MVTGYNRLCPSYFLCMKYNRYIKKINMFAAEIYKQKPACRLAGPKSRFFA